MKAIDEIHRIDQLLDLNGPAVVVAAYQLLLGRPADAGGLAYYTERVKAGYAKELIVAEIAASPEAQDRKARLSGLEELLASYRRTTHWFWGRVTRGQRIERRLNQLHYEIGLIATRLDRLESRSLTTRRPDSLPTGTDAGEDAASLRAALLPQARGIFDRLMRS